MLLNNLCAQVAKDGLPCEIIVVNDGSTDYTSAIGKDFIEKNPFVRVIDQQNKGESGARNTGIEHARGEYVYFLDCDDSIKEGSLAHFVQTISENPTVDLYCFAYTSTEYGKQGKTYQNKRLDGTRFERRDFLRAYLAKKLPIHVCSCLVKRELLNRCLLRFSVGLRIGEDIEYLLNVGSVLQTAYFSNRICYVYQIRNDSIMQGYATYSEAQYHSFEVRRDIVLSEHYQTKELRKYANFWIENQLLSNIVYYLRSSVRDAAITNRLCSDCSLLRRPIACGSLKNMLAILIARLIPMRLILKIAKRGT